MARVAKNHVSLPLQLAPTAAHGAVERALRETGIEIAGLAGVLEWRFNVGGETMNLVAACEKQDQRQ
jgi:hypothetical protein